MSKNLLTTEFHNQFVNSFPGDKQNHPYPRTTPGVLYSTVHPTPVPAPHLLGWSDSLAKDLNLAFAKTPNEVAILAGNSVTPSMRPYAACYGGHQFGRWAGQLGDGRAITLGEIHQTNSQGEAAIWEIQLKGAGITPYSRAGDGRAVLRSSVREFLMSEAMHHLGIPTTRALSLVATGTPVLRDMFYNGQTDYEPGAIVTRVAPSFLRFGSFEILTARKELENLRQLVDWSITKFYPHIQGDQDTKITMWFHAVMEKTISMLVDWMRVGFVHGVMNTDNMSILGLTIDYGPYSMLDQYDPNFTPNTTDLPGRRYAFAQQPSIGLWNLQRLADALTPLLKDPQKIQRSLESYQTIFTDKFLNMMGHKLGLDNPHSPRAKELIYDLEDVLIEGQFDMTLFYQRLSLRSSQELYAASYGNITESFGDKLEAFMKRYRELLKHNTITPSESLERMRKANPCFILRNFLLFQAIEDLNKGKDALFKRLLTALQDPYSDKHGDLQLKRPDWAKTQAGCSMLSCSS